MTRGGVALRAPAWPRRTRGLAVLRTALSSIAVAALGTGLFASPAAAGGLEVERATLDNGVQLVLSTQQSVPIVAITCLIDGGARVDPPGKAGLADITGGLLSEGTTGRSSQDIARLIDSLGGSFGTEAAADWISASAMVLSRDFGTGLDLIARSLKEPTFPQEEFDRERSEALSEIKSAEDDPGAVAGRAFRKAVFGAGPYGHAVDGTAEGVTAIKREDVVAFHRREILPRRTICAIVGDVPVAEMKAVAAKLLGSWTQGGEAKEVAPSPVPQARSVLVDMPISQANIVLGQIGVARSNPDYFPILLMNHILGGGGFTSRLMQTIRTQGGLAYNVSSHFTSTKLPGPFQVVLQTKVESASEALRLAREEVDKLHREGATEEELAAAKDFLTGNFPLKLDSTSKLSAFLAQSQYFALGDDYAERYADRVRAVTLADVKRAAATYLKPDDLVQVVVGPQAALAQQGIKASAP
jgi:zinc protease